MIVKAVLIVISAAILGFTQAALGQDSETDTNGLTILLAKVRQDLKAGKHTEADLADDLKQFDVLMAAENGQRTEAAAHILLARGMLYSEIFDDPLRAKAYFLEIKQNYANTIIATKLDPLIQMMDQQADDKRITSPEPVSVPFSDFNVTNTAGQPLSVARYKGKLVLVDFWATWSQPCQAELHNLLATYGEYHDNGFEIIGVSLDEDEDQLQKYAKTNYMSWPEYFDGKRFQNQLAVKYGITTLPANFLIDGSGNVIGTNLFGNDLPLAVARALAKRGTDAELKR